MQEKWKERIILNSWWWQHEQFKEHGEHGVVGILLIFTLMYKHLSNYDTQRCYRILERNIPPWAREKQSLLFFQDHIFDWLSTIFSKVIKDAFPQKINYWQILTCQHAPPPEASLREPALRSLRLAPTAKTERQACADRCGERRLPTRDRWDGRRGVYPPLSSWINIWSAELWWVLISALMCSLSIYWLWSLFRWAQKRTRTSVTSECQIKMRV